MTVDRSAIVDAVQRYPDWPRPGTTFRDVRAVLADPRLFHGAVDAIADHFSHGITDAGGSPVHTVLGVEARGVALAAAVAHRIDAGYVAVSRVGHLPAEVEREEFAIEYGSDLVALPRYAISTGQRVLVVDAVLGTGATLAAVTRLVRHGGAELAGVGVLLELSGGAGRSQLGEADVFAVVSEAT